MVFLSHLKNAIKRTIQRLWLIGIPKAEPNIISTHPHDPKAFTQGLIMEEGKLYESTGLEGSSSLRLLSLEQESPLRITPLPVHWGEGIACLNGEIIQLTWKSEVAVVYKLPELQPVRELPYEGEGWGITRFNDGFIISDGSEVLKIVDRNLKVDQILPVKIKGKPLKWLNDLIYAEGSLFINRLSDSNIYQVCPYSGKVNQVIDCSSLIKESQANGHEDFLNGIAYDSSEKVFFVTGKRWAKIFKVTF